MASAASKSGRASTNQEFTAIVLAGLGGGLLPFTNSENLPKALLPVANKALLAYLLSWIERAGISSVIILCVDAQEAAISSWLRTNWKGPFKPLVVAASSEDEIVGSGDAIRYLLSEKYREKVRSDVIILSCDTICEIPPHELLDRHRLSGASLTAVFHRKHAAEILTPLKKGSKSFTGYEAASNTLLYTSPVADVDEEVELRTSMLWKFPNVSFSSGLSDLHMYICKKNVLDIISEQDALSRVNTDLLPMLCKAQFQSLLRTTYSIDSSLSTKIYITKPEHFCARANTKQAFIDLNKHMLKSIPAESRQPSSTTIGERTTVGADSALGNDSAIDEKTTIKRSVIGNNVKIGKMCRITNCIIMDGVEIRDQVKLENCVLCAASIVGEKSSLKDCIIGGKVVVQDKSEKKGEEIVIGGEISMGS